ncbi:MAG: 2-amino-4-hydroxy-6-hydroxymethyldihydropteridine diphosphokinase [Candidatus Cloacimonetes bacterium]|nr:2-amino-4-hydroxy-6-hydroxymethyldihydropteridine diphosphokinase [Candidatus Cloacimonadota bacterium]
MKAYLGLGSNMGDREQYMCTAVELLSSHKDMRLIRQSKVLETAAYGLTDQADFLNQVVIIETELPAEQLLKECNRIEELLGRVRTVKWGERTMDIDILFYEDIVLQTAELQIPHADLHKREFILQSMLELEPEMVHPVLGLSMQEIYNNLEER